MKNFIPKSIIEMRYLNVLTIIIVFALIFQFFSCCNDCPTCPEDPEPGEYRLYSVGGWYQKICSVAIPADTLIDSITVDYYPGDIVVTPDGSRILVNRFDTDSMFGWMEIYRTSNLARLGPMHQYGSYFFDGGDDYGIWGTSTAVYFINTQSLLPTDSIEFVLPGDVDIGHGYLDTVSNLFFVPTSPFFHSDTTARVYVIDCISRSLIDSVQILKSWGSLANLAYNWLTNDLYIQSFQGTGSSRFFQIDLDSNMQVNSSPIVFIGGSMAISPDGRRVYMTDSGHLWFGYPPEHPIWIFDATSNQLIQWVPPYYPGAYVDPYVGRVIPTPDGRRLYVGGTGAGAPIIVVDLQTNSITNLIDPFDEFGSTSMAIGPVANPKGEREHE